MTIKRYDIHSEIVRGELGDDDDSRLIESIQPNGKWVKYEDIKTPWHKYPEEKPKSDQPVWMLTYDPAMSLWQCLCYLPATKSEWHDGEDFYTPYAGELFWMELPTPPEDV